MSMDTKDVSSYLSQDLDIFVRDVSDRTMEKLHLKVRSWAKVSDLKVLIQQHLNIKPSSQHLFFGPHLTSGKELPNHWNLQEAGISKSGETILLDIHQNSLSSSRSHASAEICISSSMTDTCPKPLKYIVNQAKQGFAVGYKPEFVLDGSGGSYFLHDSRKNKIAIFKPADEEPYAENNPRGYLQQPGQKLSMRAGVQPGEACIREVAAYLLDHKGFAGVPMTTLAEARHATFNQNGSRLSVAAGGATIGHHSIAPNSPVRPTTMKKVGSVQEFVPSQCSMDDISSSKVSVEEVQKIAVLDIRIMNADRNTANLLCSRHKDGSIKLVPIDHGYCLRSVCDTSWMDWCWLDWPQLKEPVSTEIKRYIESLDIEKDAMMLREVLNIDERAIDNFRASSALLKAGVNAGLSLYDIAVLCCRNDDLGEIPSALERMSEMATELAVAALENSKFNHHVASNALVDVLSPKGMNSYERNASSQKQLFKSVSSGDFLRLRSDSLSLEASHDKSPLSQKPESPHLLQSSDSSTDSEEYLEKEDCQEWAASLIDRLRPIQIPPAKPRATSIESEPDESELSSSPKGFWQPLPAVMADDGSIGTISWGTSYASSPKDSEGFVEPPSPSPERNMTKRASVTFADKFPGPLIPPSTVSVTRCLAVSSLLPKPKEFGMKRSRSYTALGRSYSAISEGSQSLVPSESSDKFEHFRSYFLKFIDLVIVKEITFALQQNQKKIFDTA